ncbi:20551_t:CDS:2, partial [Rhizophagus irregularis]
MEDDLGGRIEIPKNLLTVYPKITLSKMIKIKILVHLRQALTLFVKQQRNLSLGPVKSDKIQGRHEWALDKLKEEVIRPSVEPEEIIKVIDEFQDDQQEENDDVLSKISVDDVLDAEVWTNRPIVNFLKKLRESLLTEDDVIEYINECKVTIQLVEEVEKKLIPAFITHSNKIPTKEEIKEFDTNNQKMVNRLVKEDKMKRNSLRVCGFANIVDSRKFISLKQ